MIERIFARGASSQSLDPEDDYANYIRQMIDDSVTFEQTTLAPEREMATKYYQGVEPSLPDEEGRSTIVTTDVRDTILSIMPSLIRIFCSAQNVVDFIPSTEKQADMARQATDYVNHVIWSDNEGFLVIHDALKDALTLKLGIIKWWTDHDTTVQQSSYTGITQEQYQMLIAEAPDATVESLETAPDGTLSLTIQYNSSSPMQRIASVPPEEFRLDREATSIYTSNLVGHERLEKMSTLVKRGYDPEELAGFIGTPTSTSDERFLRNPGLSGYGYLDDGVNFGEYYIRVDGDGDGVDELRYIATIGENHEIVEDYIVDAINFAVFSPDPTPHTVVGDSIATLVMDIQKIKTNVMRGVLDSLAESIWPRTVVNETLTNMDDVMNTEQGAVIRTRGDPGTAVVEQRRSFVGADATPIMDYLDQIRASRTGITEASKGLDPEAMQSTAQVGINAIVTGAQERIELIARILCETGFKHLFKGILKEIVNNPNKPRTIPLRGSYVEIDPSLFDSDLRLKVNPTLGKGSDMTRLMALQDIKLSQENIIAKYGIKNPVVGPIEYRNTIVDMLEIVNIRNPGRYFKEITPEVEQGIMAAPDQPDPQLLLAQSEMEKVRATTAGKIATVQHDQSKLDRQLAKDKSDDDFRRDKLDVDATIAAAQISVDQVEIAQRPVLEAMNQPPANQGP